jgi:hypothetical protein
MSLQMRLHKERKAQDWAGVNNPWNSGVPMIGPGVSGMPNRYSGGVMFSRGRQGQAGGFFGTIGKALAGVAGTLLGGVPIVGDTLKGIAAGSLDKRSKTQTAGGAQNPSMNISGMTGVGPGMGSMPTLSLPMGGGAMPVSSGGVVSQFFGGGTAVGPHRPGSTDMAPRGYHWNKSGYWKNTNPMLPGASWIPPGSILVRNRTRNPFNPQAASRSMSRLSSLHKGMKVLEKHMARLAPRKAPCRTHSPIGRKK